MPTAREIADAVWTSKITDPVTGESITARTLLACVVGASLSACHQAKTASTPPKEPRPVAIAPAPSVAAPAAPETPPAPLPDRIDLGINLFDSGSDKFRAGAKESIDAKLSAVPRTTVFDVEAFLDRSGIAIHRRRPYNDLGKARGEAVKRHLTAAGFTIREVIVRGPVTYQGRAPSRRLELVVVKP